MVVGLASTYVHIAAKSSEFDLLLENVYLIQLNLSKLNLLGTNFCDRNRQVFSLYRLNKQNFPSCRLHLKISPPIFINRYDLLLSQKYLVKKIDN